MGNSPAPKLCRPSVIDRKLQSDLAKKNISVFLKQLRNSMFLSLEMQSEFSAEMYDSRHNPRYQ